jgi:hypothetical protein
MVVQRSGGLSALRDFGPCCGGSSKTVHVINISYNLTPSAKIPKFSILSTKPMLNAG